MQYPPTSGWVTSQWWWNRFQDLYSSDRSNNYIVPFLSLFVLYLPLFGCRAGGLFDQLVELNRINISSCNLQLHHHPRQRNALYEDDWFYSSTPTVWWSYKLGDTFYSTLYLSCRGKFKISLQIWVFQIMDEWIKNNMEMEKCQFLLHIPPVQLLLWCVKWELSGS